MEETNYYIPEIEEFYQGFEYYIFSKGFDFKIPFIFEPHQLDIHFNMKIDSYGWKVYSVPNNDEFKIMVKYLDKEDIKAEGFSIFLIENHKIFSVLIKEKVRYNLIFNLNSKQLLIYLSTDALHPWPKETVFNGVIKNRSELKRILKMINI